MDELDRLEFYAAADGVRWRYRAAGNHEVLADGSQGYARVEQAKESAFRVINIDAEASEVALLASGAAPRRDPLSPGVEVFYDDSLF